jgi:DNA-binding MarR family transcriptional regulator
MAATIAALEKRGFIERRPDPGDGRRQFLALTSDTGTQIEVHRKARRDRLATALDGQFTATERAEFTKAVRLLAEY